ncbi:hypothetical protein [Streptomyces sp. P17]|uniref:hypothetical protein n=1 Tax=Streptomyces sp. P17 TaxID=3074716 RepID=UPI0028F4222C|nr:hypothetical protein [Streptomyces sp. P17]MDT9701116.1 hypothetical protein [Streptomyces sp. P17]
MTVTRNRRREDQLRADILSELAEIEAPLTAPGRPSRTDPNGWSYGYSDDIDRTTLAWATTYRRLTDHQPDAPRLSHIYAADALLRECRVTGLATLHQELAGGPVNYRFTRCPYCWGSGEDPVEATCDERGCLHGLDADHEHLCPVCRGEEFAPEYFGPDQIQLMDERLARALVARTPAPRPPLRRLLRRNRAGQP